MAVIRGQPILGTLSQALEPVLAVAKGSNPLLLLLKQAGGLGQGALRLAALNLRPWDHFKDYMVEISMKSL